MSPILNKLLKIQLLIQKKVNGIVFDNDVKGCYGRIISGFSLATLRRLGYSRNSLRMLGILWAQMQHHRCCGFGVSKDTCGSSVDKLLYGIGQGSCALPILWTLLNQIIISALEGKFDCIRLVAVDVVEEHIRPGDSFIDVTTCGVTYDNVDMKPVPASVTNLTNGEEALVGNMEEILQLFLDLLQVTGGGPGLEKMCMVPHSFHMEGGEYIHSNPKRNTQRNRTTLPVNRNTNNYQAQDTIGEPQDTQIPPQRGRDIHRTNTCYDGQHKTV
jgi:hypothetical protein